MRASTSAAAAAFVLACAAPATAESFVDEVRVGVNRHDMVDHTEDGPQITLEALFDSPDVLRRIASPRPFVHGSFNTKGNTNLGSVGLAWGHDLGERLAIEGALGIAYHDGVLDLDFENDTPSNLVRLDETRALLGSRFLFRTEAALDMNLTERWRMGVYYEHYSHGQILGSGRNQGLDEAGVRLGYKFGRDD